MTHNLPSGTRNIDIDRAAPGYDDPPCKWIEDAQTGLVFCERCGAQWEWQCEPEKKR